MSIHKLVTVLIIFTVVVVGAGFFLIKYFEQEEKTYSTISQDTSLIETNQTTNTSTETLEVAEKVAENPKKETSVPAPKAQNTPANNYSSDNSGISFTYNTNKYVVFESPITPLWGTNAVYIEIIKKAEEFVPEDQISAGIKIFTYDNAQGMSSLEWAQSEPRLNFSQREDKAYETIVVDGKTAIRYSQQGHIFLNGNVPQTNPDGSYVYIDAKDTVIVVHGDQGTSFGVIYKDPNDPIRADFNTLIKSIKFK
jgi:hypothetical protein